LSRQFIKPRGSPMAHENSAILLSGGIDSTALACWHRPAVAITIDYGQVSAAGEIRAAKQICRELDITHDIVSIDCRALGAGDLANAPIAKDAPASEWWPFRNQLLVTIAIMRAYALQLNSVLVGSVQSDSFHSDGRIEFYDKLDELVAMQEG